MSWLDPHILPGIMFGIIASIMMPPIWGRATGVPVGRDWGRQPTETNMHRDMRRLEEILEAMEIKKHSDNSYNSDEEEESSEEEKEYPEKEKSFKYVDEV